MSRESQTRFSAWMQDRRVQVGGVVGLSLAAALGAGVIATVMNSRADATQPDMAQQARLTIVSQSAPKTTPVSTDKLATIDPNQPAAVSQDDQADPALKAMLEEERREDLRMAAEQKAFDAHMRAQMASPSEEDVPPLPDQQWPAQRGGWTSNTEDTAPTPG